MTTDILPGYEVKIRPNQNWLQIKWGELWRARDLIYLFVKRDFTSKYKQTVLGPAWAVLQPVLMTLVFTVVFKQIAGMQTGNQPGPVYFMCALLGWNYFAQVLGGTGTTFASNADLFKKVYFPRLALPISMSFSTLIPWLIQLVTFLAFVAYYKLFDPAAGAAIQTQWEVLLLPLILLHTAMFGLGMGFLFSTITAKYRDFRFLLPLITQLWMYGSAVVFPYAEARDKLGEWALLLFLNPMTAVVESYKFVFLGEGVVEPLMYAISAGITVLVFFGGLLLFQRTERNFQDFA